MGSDRVPAVDAEGLLVVSTLNTRGVPVTGSRLSSRMLAIGAAFEASDSRVVCLQEVFTYWQLRLLARRMASFGHVSYCRSVAGPAGGLVTFSRLPLSGTSYRGFAVPLATPGMSRQARLRAGMKGALVTRLANPRLALINTHPVANRDGDWSEASRFYPAHRGQLASLAGIESMLARSGPEGNA